MRKRVWNVLAVGAFMAAMAACSSSQVQLGDLHVVPMPQSVVSDSLSKPFVLNRKTVIVCQGESDRLRKTAQFLSDYVKETSGLELKISDRNSSDNAIVLRVDSTRMGKEAYELNITEAGVQLTGGSEAGVFYGVQTLRKSLPIVAGKNDVLPALPSGCIKDEPRFPYRGFLVDVGRHYFSVSYLKEMIDMFALHNMNYFHWHLTEDQGWRIEIKKYPKLTEIGSKRDSSLIQWEPRKFDNIPVSGYYTQEEAKEIVKYAADRFITVIPEVDLPGHMMAALAAYPELGCTGGPYEIPCGWGVFEDVLCGGNAKTLQFAKDVLNEIMDIFPSPYIHIGGDECPKSRWEKCPACQAKIKELGLKSTPKHSKENQLQTYFMSEIGDLIASRGRKMMGWDEMLEGGLAPGATVMSWTSYKPAIETASLHHDVIITPIQYLYFSNPHFNKIYGIKSLERVYNFNPMPEEIPADEQKYVIGSQGCLWTEWTADSLKMEWQIFPRMAALAELQWSQPNTRNMDGFLHRLNHQLDIYELMGYHYRPEIWAPTIYTTPVSATPSEAAKLTSKVYFRTIDGAEVHYTLDGSDPSASSPLFKDTLMVDAPAQIRAIAVRSGRGVSEISADSLVIKVEEKKK